MGLATELSMAEAMLPAQLEGVTDRGWSGERRLMLAVLESGIRASVGEGLGCRGGARRADKARQVREARRWVGCR